MATPVCTSAAYDGVEQLSAEACLAIARNAASQSNVTVVNVTMATLSDTPVGFLGDHYKVTISAQAADSAEALHVVLFVKTKPRNAKFTPFLERWGLFDKERLFFTDLVPLLGKYADGGADPWLPRCVFTDDRLIALEDLTHRGFAILEGRAEMDSDQLAATFRALAGFHASSIVAEEMEERRRWRAFRLDQEFPEVFRETFWTSVPGSLGRQLVQPLLKAVLTLAGSMPELGPTLAAALARYLGDEAFDEGCVLAAKSAECRNVMTHGDLWQNNVMFRRGDGSTSAPGVRLIDFQLLRYAPPALDFAVTLALNAARATRRQHAASLARIYHATLTAALARHGLDAEALCGWTQFEASVQTYHGLGLLTRCLYLPSTLLPAAVASALFADADVFARFMLEDRSAPAAASFASDPEYRRRTAEAIQELAEFVALRAEA